MKYFIGNFIFVSDKGTQLPDIEQIVIQTNFDTLKKSVVEKELTDLLRKHKDDSFIGYKVIQIGNLYDASNDPAAVQSVHILSRTYKIKEVVSIMATNSSETK